MLMHLFSGPFDIIHIVYPGLVGLCLPITGYIQIIYYQQSQLKIHSI